MHRMADWGTANMDAGSQLRRRVHRPGIVFGMGSAALVVSAAEYIPAAGRKAVVGLRHAQSSGRFRCTRLALAGSG